MTFNEEKFLSSLDDIDAGAGFSLLLQGPHNSGKTHFLGDALLHEQQYGPVRYVSFPGEDGYRTISNLGLGNVMFTPQTKDDLEGFCHYWKSQGGLRLLAIDSVLFLQELSMRDTLKSDRQPIIEKFKNEWTDVHNDFQNLFNLIKSTALYTVFAVPSDIETVNEWDGSDKHRTWTPELAGKPARRIGGWVDFCFALRPMEGPKGVVRKLMTQYSDNYTNRQRLPNGGITKNIDLPTGSGGWKALLEAIDSAYKRKG